MPRKKNVHDVQTVKFHLFREGSVSEVYKEHLEKKYTSKEPTELAQIVGQVFSPLDEKLELQPGSLTPLQLSYLVHFSSFHSFEEAAQMLQQHHGVCVSASTSRRQAEAIGACAEVVQDEQAKAVVLQESSSSEKEDTSKIPAKQAISSDGCHISLRGKVYAEVKTAVIGEVQENKRRFTQRPDQEVKMTKITYFSRMAPSETFTTLATGEIDRRKFFQARKVCAVSDGAEWIQHFIDAYRTDTIRILDFYHAAEYVSEIATLVRDAGTVLPESWKDQQLHELKHHGPQKVLAEVKRLLKEHPDVEDLAKAVNYLQKREKMMQYPLFRAEGWPIGSGSAESSNTCVVQSRLKGPGMHWEQRNVNPMLALRIGVCNERWEETRNQAFRHRLKVREATRVARQKKRYETVKQKVEHSILRLCFLYSLNRPKTTKMPASSPKGDVETASPDIINTKNACHPAKSHPWRRYHRAKM
jgi:hypothetical protein